MKPGFGENIKSEKSFSDKKDEKNSWEDGLNVEEKKMLEEIRYCADKISGYRRQAEMNNIEEATFKSSYKWFAGNLFYILRDVLSNDGLERGYTYAAELLDNFKENVEKCAQNDARDGISLAELRDRTKKLQGTMSGILYSDPVYDE
jgi:uncharacterized protein YtpQ (UPF0354 family)